MSDILLLIALSIAVPTIAAMVMAVATALESRAPAQAEVRALRRGH